MEMDYFHLGSFQKSEWYNMGITLKNIKREQLIKSTRPKQKKRPMGNKQILDEIKYRLKPQTIGLNPKEIRKLQISTVENFSTNFLKFRRKNKRNPNNSEIQQLITKAIAETYLALRKKRTQEWIQIKLRQYIGY